MSGRKRCICCCRRRRRCCCWRLFAFKSDICLCDRTRLYCYRRRTDRHRGLAAADVGPAQTCAECTLCNIFCHPLALLFGHLGKMVFYSTSHNAESPTTGSIWRRASGKGMGRFLCLAMRAVSKCVSRGASSNSHARDSLRPQNASLGARLSFAQPRHGSPSAAFGSGRASKRS